MAPGFVQVEVQAYSGFKANERPMRFRWAGRDFLVTDVLDRWYEGGRTPKDPTLNYFKVRTDQGEEFILRYNGLFDVWSILVRDT